MNKKTSSDLWFLAFLTIKGYKISEYQVIERGKIRASYDIDEEVWRNLKLEFHNSEVAKYKTTIEQLKDLGF